MQRRDSKSLEAVKSTYLLENNNQINKDLRPLQKSYLFLKKWKADGLFCVFIKLLNKPIKSNLLSNNPSMFLFDIYRLKYFIELNNNNNSQLSSSVVCNIMKTGANEFIEKTGRNMTYSEIRQMFG